MELKGKKLLFIGANGNIFNAVKTAKEMGIHTIVVDYFENSPAKKIADESYLISTADTDKLAELCTNKKVDGVFTGYSELNLNFTERLCSRMNYPFYATKEQIEILTNKEKFKNACKEFGVPSVPNYEINENSLEKSLDRIHFPVIVKPVDSYSGKGITICNNRDDVKLAIEKAKGVSISKKCLIEKFMNDEEYDIFTVYYTLQDGESALSGIVDRYMYSFENNRRLSTILKYPSEYLPRYMKEMDQKVKGLFKGLELKNGTIFIEGAVNKEGFYFWECGYRLCGAQQGIIAGAVNNVDVERLLIEYALTGRMSSENVLKKEDPYLKGKSACNLLVFSKIGTIDKIVGVDEVLKMDGVINYTELIDEGHTITKEEEGTLNQSVARLHLVADNDINMTKLIDKIFNTIKLLDTNGNNLLLKTYDKEFFIGKCTRFS